jgi:hypothetical protein
VSLRHSQMNAIRHSQIWGPEYAKQRLLRTVKPAEHLKRIWVMLADHHEPRCGGADLKTAQDRVALWRSTWPAIAKRCNTDAVGNSPCYTFFFPEEEYHPTLLAPLAEMVREGIADVEVHLHHDGEGRQNFIDRISRFCEDLHNNHGLLRERDGKLAFGFIHGNWALANSRPDGRWCGLNDEIELLRNLGCYADFTMPSGNSPTQARLVNTIYWSKSDSSRPKSYDRGIPLTIGGPIAGELLMIPGPLGVRWKGRLRPRLETGEVASYDVVTPYRIKRWLELSPRLGDDCFIKLYSHGAQERNSGYLLEGGLEAAFNSLVAAAQQCGCNIYFVSAWQMYLAIDALRRGLDPALALRRQLSAQTVNK